MKRYYEKPMMQVERFVANHAVAACGDNSLDQLDKIQVNCVVNGTEYIFGAACASQGGADVTAASSGTNWYTKAIDVTSTDADGNEITSQQWYFVWYTGRTSGQPTAEQQKILSACGITRQGWHAAPYTQQLGVIQNAS